MTEIRNRWTRDIICEGDKSLKELVEENKVNLEGADLRRANLEGANLEGANLIRADLVRADLVRVNLEGADLRGADLRDADLYGANLRDADLKGADLEGANLNGANLRDADLRGAELDNPIMFFTYNKHTLQMIGNYIRIGCTVMTDKEWIEKGEEIGNEQGYTKEEIDKYLNFIKNNMN